MCIALSSYTNRLTLQQSLRLILLCRHRRLQNNGKVTAITAIQTGVSPVLHSVAMKGWIDGFIELILQLRRKISAPAQPARRSKAIAKEGKLQRMAAATCGVENPLFV